MARSERVLVLDIGEAPYSLAVARSLGRAGYEVEFGFPVGSPLRESTSKYCGGVVSYPDPAYAHADFQDRIRDLAPSFRFIVPTKEGTLLATAEIRGEVEAKGAVVPIADHASLQTATDKLEMLKLAESVGVRTPHAVITRTPPAVEELSGTLGLPFVMKVASEIGLRPIERHDVIDRTNLETYPAKFAALAAHGPVILQEFVQGTGVGISLLYSRDQKLVAYSGHERLFEQFSDGGPSVLARTLVDPTALAQSRRLLEALQWKGIAMVEFRRDSQGTPVFMEVNPRFWGTLTLAIASGVDFPRLLLETYGTTTSREPAGPTEVRNYFSFEVLTTSITSPPEKRPKLTPLFFQLSRSLPGLSIREFQGLDVRPSFGEFLHHLRARGSKRRVSSAGGISLGPAADYRALVHTGVKTIIDLREPSEVAQNPLVVPEGLQRVGFPIVDDTGIDPVAFARLAELIGRAAERGGVYIHCRLGRGRAPMAVAGYLVWKGTPSVGAFRTVYDARPYATLQSSQKAAVYLFERALRPPGARAPTPRGSPDGRGTSVASH